MILAYRIHDAYGNSLLTIVQAPTRHACDIIVAAECKEQKGLKFDLKDAEVSDLTNETVLSTFVMNHETGETIG